MTKVNFNPIESTTKPIIHRMGNFYESQGEVYILAHVGNKGVSNNMCLVSLLTGNRSFDPVAVLDCTNISEKEFKTMCGTYKFNLIETITVNFSK